MRKTEILKNHWRFRRDAAADAISPEFDDSDWEIVQVPHDWAISGPFRRENDLQNTRILQNGETVSMPHYGRTGSLPHIGRGCYRRIFQLDRVRDGQRFRLECDGIMSHAEVFVNGKFAGARPYGYSSFSLDITDLIVGGAKNLLAVTVENPPASSRWYPGAGLLREIRLVKVEQNHFPPSGIWIFPKMIDPKRRHAIVGIQAERNSHLPVQLIVLDSAGKTVATQEFSTRETELELRELQLWSPDAPLLYRFHFSLAGQDDLTIPFGFRRINFTPDTGMTLNGKLFRFRGVCLHHDLGPLGAAFSRDGWKHRLEQLKSIGCNAIRTSHNPPDPQFLDLCDELGFAVIDEAFDAWRLGKTTNDYATLFDQWHERDLTDLIRRDRNHPCVFAWSIGNEINEQTSPDGAAVARELAAIAHRADPYRPVTAALDRPDDAIANGLAQELDLVGWNYKPLRYGELHQKLPNQPQYGSETASTLSSRGEYFFPAIPGASPRHPNLQCNSYDTEYPPWASTPDTEFSRQDACGWLLGEFVWTGFDYLGEPTPYDDAGPAHSSYFGIFDLAGFPKDRAYLYRARWRNGILTTHLLPHWNWPAGTVLPVHVYTNADEAELFLNGRSLGKRIREESSWRLVWENVRFEPGTLEVHSWRNGETGSDRRQTAGTPARIRLEAESCGELIFITAAVTDETGVPVPDAGNELFFSVTGAGEMLGLGNGNALSEESFQADHMHAFHGHLAAILRRNLPGELHLTVQGNHLETAKLEWKESDL